MAGTHPRSTASVNFDFAKVCAIIIVATAHFFPDTLLWIPATVALFVFGFSSAYFTHIKYRSMFEVGPYWINKIPRLGFPLLAIDLFLLMWCAIYSSQSIWVWQTLPHLIGLGGIVGWFGVPNASPLGGGMWFFTLLLLFYGVYPILRLINRTRWGSWGLLAAILAMTSYCQVYHPLEYSLWPTIFSFVLGVFIAERSLPSSGMVWAVGGVVSTFAMGILNAVLHINAFNYWLILVLSVCTTLWLLDAPLPGWVSGSVACCTDILLEIYLLHTYLFVTPTGSRIVDFVLSLAVIVAMARVVHTLANWLARRTMVPLQVSRFT